jgi:nitroimidazol reductase NimA-like FMN-containing flavoprotein (pyridoxamine 5'-phosphate oxidase superfamily)
LVERTSIDPKGETMATTEPRAERVLDRYGSRGIEWDNVRAQLEEGLSQAPGEGGPGRHTHWLATTDPDGGPHVVPVGALWVDGVYYFTSGAGTRKSRNLSKNPRCAITVATHEFDLVVEGTASKVTDPHKLQRVAAAYADGGWPASVRDGSLTAEYSAPSAGPPPWDLYEVTPARGYALGTAEPYGASAWAF